MYSPKAFLQYGETNQSCVELFFRTRHIDLSTASTGSKLPPCQAVNTFLPACRASNPKTGVRLFNANKVARDFSKKIARRGVIEGVREFDLRFA